MFNRKLRERIDSEAENRRRNYDEINRKYWELRHDLDLLLDHIGAHIDSVPSHRVIRKKGGPEKG